MTLPLCHITNAFIRFREGVGHFYQRVVLLAQLVNASLCIGREISMKLR